MTKISCPKCEGSVQLLFAAHDSNRKISDQRFDYYRCDACRFIFLSPIPEDLGRYYPSDYYDVPQSKSELDNTATRLQQWKVDVMTEFARPGRLLEIGPAYGLFAHLAKKAGFEVTAIEMNSRCCSFLRETVGIEVVESAQTLEALNELPLFDVIVLWQVVEHLPNPWSVLDAVADHLAPGGVLILDTPNPEAFQFSVLGRYWTHVDAPRHVSLISAPLLVEHMSRADMSLELLTATDRSAIGFNSFGWAFSLKNFFQNPALSQAAHLFGRLLTKLLIPIERTGFRGSTYTAVFRKGAVR